MNITGKHNHILFISYSGLFILCLLVAIWFEAWYLAAIPFAVLIALAGWQYSNLIFLLLLATLPFSTELQYNEALGTDFPDELLMVFVSGLFFFQWLYSPGLLPKKITAHPLILLIGIAFTWTIITVIFSTDRLISFKFLLAKCWYLGAFLLAPLIIFQEKRMIKIAIIVLALAVFAVALITIVRHIDYGFSFSGINDALVPFFRNHVNYSAMVVSMVPIFFAFYKLGRSRSTRALMIVMIIILIIALFLSYARGAWLALIAGIVAYWLIKNKLMVVGYIVSLIIVIVSCFWLISGDRYLRYAHDYRTTIFHSDFREHLQATYKFKDVSTAERFYRWIAGIRMLKENPLTGFGPSAFYSNYKPYAVPAFKTWVSSNKERSTVHNYFLMVAIEQGIPGLLFFLLLVGVVLYYAQHLYHRATDHFYKLTAITSGVIVVMIMTVNFLSDLIETDKVGSIFFLCLSVLIITDVNTKPGVDT